MGQQQWLAGCRARPSVSVRSTSEIPGGVGCLRPAEDPEEEASRVTGDLPKGRVGLVWAELKRKQQTRAMESRAQET